MTVNLTKSLGMAFEMLGVILPNIETIFPLLVGKSTCNIHSVIYQLVLGHCPKD